MGSFISADTVQGFNRYLYVAGNPINRTDPSGNYIPEERERYESLEYLLDWGLKMHPNDPRYSVRYKLYVRGLAQVQKTAANDLDFLIKGTEYIHNRSSFNPDWLAAEEAEEGAWRRVAEISQRWLKLSEKKAEMSAIAYKKYDDYFEERVAYAAQKHLGAKLRLENVERKITETGELIRVLETNQAVCSQFVSMGRYAFGKLGLPTDYLDIYFEYGEGNVFAHAALLTLLNNEWYVADPTENAVMTFSDYKKNLSQEFGIRQDWIEFYLRDW